MGKGRKRSPSTGTSWSSKEQQGAASYFSCREKVRDSLGVREKHQVREARHATSRDWIRRSYVAVQARDPSSEVQTHGLDGVEVLQEKTEAGVQSEVGSQVRQEGWMERKGMAVGENGVVWRAREDHGESGGRGGAHRGQGGWETLCMRTNCQR